MDTICRVTGGGIISGSGSDEIEHLVYDSRRIQQASSSLFFALKTSHGNGHRFLHEAWERGVRNFIVQENPENDLPESTIIRVSNVLTALQSLAAFHRSRFTCPVIGITGSNGKTMVKEWLYQLLQEDYQVVRSPKSFNSQIGVPLSVWQMREEHTLAIFEAGISRPGEMESLYRIIQPTIGVITNIGEAHSEGFVSQQQKAEEKIRLFQSAGIVVYKYDDEIVAPALAQWKVAVEHNTSQSHFKLLGWGKSRFADLQIIKIEKESQGRTLIEILHQASGNQFQLRLPFTDEASLENALTCCGVMMVLGYQPDVISSRMEKLHPISMRLQLNQSINDCLVINDSYSADITSLRIALDFLQQQGAGRKRTVILSEFMESGKDHESLYLEIASLLNSYSIEKILLIGPGIGEAIRPALAPGREVKTFEDTDEFIRMFRGSNYNREIILIKGARKFTFERIARLFEKKLHETVLEVNLNALVHNLKEYQRILQPGTKLMAMVKAFSYGSGGAEIASVLQYHHTGYLGVAYADEGVDLVRAGIQLPIMVMNAEISSFASIVDFGLQPVLYSFDLLRKFEEFLNDQGLNSYPVHLELETGMNRLGFEIQEAEELGIHLASSKTFSVQSVFSHLAASEDPKEDAFTLQQAERFEKAVRVLQQHIPYRFLRHISNSAAILRHPQLQWDMVRLGIGLYGIETDEQKLLNLQAVATLRSTIAQLKKVNKGESVSYNRKGRVDRNSLIATVRIGYADGYSRQFSNGRGYMLVRGRRVPVVGTVCMDMTMVDVTDVEGVEEGDDVIVFGPSLPVQELAAWASTIPYEVMTGISQRVKRIYFHE